jgi:adenylyltransferase/sulfurtransferase
MLTPDQQARYERQLLFRPIGAAGQEKLLGSTVAVVGVGAIGCLAADMLARCGVGRLRLIDPDIVELSNLQRQMLYNEEDVASGRPKAEIAATKLRRVNSTVEISSHIEHLTDDNAARLLQGAEVIVDAVDNFAAKFALNRAALQLGIPMMYGALAGSYGVMMPILPGESGCLCCLYCAEPDKGSSETAATAGVIPATVATVASLQVAQTLKWLVGVRADIITDLIHIEVWEGEMWREPVPRRADCAACGGADS